ncbi:hypothetical protein [Saccharopolyspora hattusasensis]|uniref:hypothetical protein n=1 Tax=Saccharopolyspora hattusasensis TaxID=1128679 RepID=UPI003D9970A4
MTKAVAEKELRPAEHDMVGCVGVFGNLEHRIFAGARPMLVSGRVAYWAACNLLAFPSTGETFSERPLAQCQNCARALRATAAIDRLSRDIQCLWAPAGTADVQRYRLWQTATGTGKSSCSQRFAHT